MQLKTLNGEVAKLAARGEAPTRGLSNVLVSDTSIAYAFIAPAFFLLLFLVAYPFVLSLWFSLSDARVGDTGTFVGLENFRRLLRSGRLRLAGRPQLQGGGDGARGGDQQKEGAELHARRMLPR